MFKRGYGNWIDYRNLVPPPLEIDYHAGEGENDGLDYWQRMSAVPGGVLKILRKAQDSGDKWVMFRHGCSTSRPDKTTCRSQIRACMRSPDATPFIIRKECIQHYSVFVAAIRAKVGRVPMPTVKKCQKGLISESED